MHGVLLRVLGRFFGSIDRRIEMEARDYFTKTKRKEDAENFCSFPPLLCLGGSPFADIASYAFHMYIYI